MLMRKSSSCKLTLISPSFDTVSTAYSCPLTYSYKNKDKDKDKDRVKENEVK